jgi:hypothetical protein
MHLNKKLWVSLAYKDSKESIVFTAHTNDKLSFSYGTIPPPLPLFPPITIATHMLTNGEVQPGEVECAESIREALPSSWMTSEFLRMVQPTS